MSEISLPPEAATVNEALLTVADQLVLEKIGTVLIRDECYGWDRNGFDPAKTYLPIPPRAKVLLVSRYTPERALATATYHIPEDGMTFEVRAEDPEDTSGLAVDVLSSLKKYRPNPDVIAVQAFRLPVAAQAPAKEGFKCTGSSHLLSRSYLLSK